MKGQVTQKPLMESSFRGKGRRDQITIMTDLLGIIEEPQRLTHILYKSNMSYGQLVKYLVDMLDHGLIDEQMEPFRAYSITSKGKQFLKIMEKN